MAIRLGNTCQNCEKFGKEGMCAVHRVKVGAHYTCDSFAMKAELADKRDCTSCQRFEREDCANPTKAAAGMLCSVWAPQNVTA